MESPNNSLNNTSNGAVNSAVDNMAAKTKFKLLIEPKIIKNICTNAHPDGCKKNVDMQIDYVRTKDLVREGGPKNVLIVGGSTGYGLASRIVASYGYKARTLNIAYEAAPNSSRKRTGSAGWYNTHYFDERARQDGYYAHSIIGDAFSHATKDQAIEVIKRDLGSVDLLIYSLASGRRTNPNTGQVYNSVLKPIGKEFSEKTIDVLSKQVSTVTVSPATEHEIEDTVRVMGGDDWKLWIDALQKAGVLSNNFITLSYSYIGPELTHKLYRSGTIGRAKEDLEERALQIDAQLQKADHGRAYISVNKALVTRASMVIPVVPLYLSILYKVMKQKFIHEDCIAQMTRLFEQKLYNTTAVITDEQMRIRMDDWEMREDVQAEVLTLWNQANENTINDICDLDGFVQEFYNIHGFSWPTVDYTKESEIE